MFSHTWRMQWTSCWRTEKILVSMALQGSSLNSKYIRMLPTGPAWGELLETGRVHGGQSRTHSDYVVNAGFHWVSQGLPDHVSERCMGFLQFSTSSVTVIHVKQSLWATELLEAYSLPQLGQSKAEATSGFKQHSEYEFELVCLPMWLLTYWMISSLPA